MPDLKEVFPLFRDDPHLTAMIVEGKPLSYATVSALVDARCKEKTPQSTFEAHTNLDSILNLLSCWQCDLTALPFNPRLPDQVRKTLNIKTNTFATLLATSGTSGTPKIAVHSFDNYRISAASSAQALSLGPGQSWHLSLPLFHVSGLSILFRCLMTGTTLVLAQDTFSYNASHYSLVPTQLYRVLQDERKIAFYKTASCLLLGGAPLTVSLYEQALRAGLPIFTTWGMTETTAMATLDGTILPHIEVSLSDDGEICVRGPSLFQGYWEEDEILRPFDKERWFATRDLGAIDPHGRLFWKGRKDSLFISGGENIQPEEIEQALGRLPDVVEATVVPVEDPEFGARPAAFLRTLSGVISSEAIREMLSAHLPRYKIPHVFLPFPDDSTLKPNRSFLIQIAMQQKLIENI